MCVCVCVCVCLCVCVFVFVGVCVFVGLCDRTLEVVDISVFLKPYEFMCVCVRERE